MHACRGYMGVLVLVLVLDFTRPRNPDPTQPNPTHGVVAREGKRKSLHLRLSLALRSALLTQSRSRSVSSPLTITLSHHRLRSIINGATHILQLTSPHPPILPSFHPHPPIPILPMLNAPCPVRPRALGHWALGTPLRLKQLNSQLFINKRTICLSSLRGLRSAVRWYPGPRPDRFAFQKPGSSLWHWQLCSP